MLLFFIEKEINNNFSFLFVVFGLWLVYISRFYLLDDELV